MAKPLPHVAGGAAENGVSGKPTLAERVAERPTMVPIAGGSARPSRRCCVRVGSVLRSRTGQIVNAGGRDLTLEATLKRDRNMYRVTAMRELTSLSTDLNLA